MATKRTVEWWQIEDTDFCYFEVSENGEVVWTGITALRCIGELLNEEKEENV